MCDKNKVSTFGERVKMLRIKHNMTPQQLADRAGIDVEYLLLVERDEIDYPHQIVFKLSNAFIISTTELLKEDNNVTIAINDDVAKHYKELNYKLTLEQIETGIVDLD